MGKKFRRLGNNETTKYGEDIPKLMNINIKSIIVKDCVNATVIAVPTNGAEHGVAIIVAKKPLKKSRK